MFLSMAGIPPVAGFFAKYFIFTGAMKDGYTWLVLVAILSSLIGVYYYFRVMVTLFQPAVRESAPVAFPQSSNLVLWITALATIAVGVFPMLLIGLL
jgi:NADH-quinone oxidoreductase subunit N